MPRTPRSLLRKLRAPASRLQSPFVPLARIAPYQGAGARCIYNVGMKTKTLPVALVQERNRGDAAANLAVIEQRVAEAAKSGA